MKTCNKCNVDLDESSFYRYSSGRLQGSCKVCIKKYNNDKYAADPEYKNNRIKRAEKYKSDPERALNTKNRSAKFYESISGRAKTLLKSASRRCGNFPEKFDLDYEFILDKLNTGVCEVTGIYFDFSKPESTSKNPYAPSIDRIDSKIGYTKSNTRIVIWQYNMMKGELSDEELLKICLVLTERKTCTT